MTKEITTTKIAIFQKKEVRKVIYKNEWWFSVVDVIEVLTGTERPRKYWSDLKKKLENEGFIEVSEKIGQLKIIAPDGKKRETDCANTETIATFGMTPSEYQKLKGLKRENLRDHMNDLELIFTMLGEASTTEIARNKNTQGLPENKMAAREGGAVAGKARKDLELKSGKEVSTNKNYLPKTKDDKKLRG